MLQLLLPLLFAVQSPAAPLGAPLAEDRPSARIVRLDRTPLETRLESIDLGSVGLEIDDLGRRVFELEAPIAARSAGLWFRGELGTSSWSDASDPLASTHPIVRWHDLDPELVGSDRPAGDAYLSGLIHARGERPLRLRIALGADAVLADLSVLWMAAPNELLELDGVPDTPPIAFAGSYPKPPVYTRAFWGANAPNCTYAYCSVTHLAVHHSASTSDYTGTTLTQVAGDVKAIQTFHMVSNGWCDIGYNYVISKQGWIFEGRGGGDDVRGAHDGFNCGSMGVCALGYFHPPFANPPTGALLDAYAELFAWKCAQKNLNPTGSSLYAAFGATKPTIYGHRDVSSTACPGDGLYAQLPGLRADVASLLNGGGGTNGTLKGVLYDAALGSSVRIAGGTVTLGNGSFTTSDGSGYWEFPLPAGTYGVAATAPGFNAGSSSETVTSGDVWESLGLSGGPVPAHQVSPSGPNQVLSTYAGDPGSPVVLGYSTQFGVPLLSFGSLGPVWPALGSVQTLPLGLVPGGGQLAVQLQTPPIPGLAFHTQGLVVSGGVQRLTNGRSWIAP